MCLFSAMAAPQISRLFSQCTHSLRLASVYIFFYFIYSYILICHFNFRSPNLFVFIMICLYFALLVTMSGKENGYTNDQKIVLFAAVGRKSVHHRTENQIKARTKLFSNSVLANTLTVNFFCACFPRFLSSMALWAKGSNLHTRRDTLQYCRHQLT